MRGTLVRRGKSCWALVLDLGYAVDPTTGKRTRQQKWVSFRGTRKEAEKKLTDIVGKSDRGEFIEPSKVTLIEYLRSWLEKIKPMRRPATHRVYKSIVENHVATSPLGTMLLQQVRGSHLETYYATRTTAAASSLSVDHAILHRAFKVAVKDKLLSANPAVDLERRRASKDPSKAARLHCWTAAEARRFLIAAKEAGSQVAAFFALALDSGARKSELYGLGWQNVDLDAGTITIDRQLDTIGVAPTFTPTFGPTKTQKVRTVPLGAETVMLLRTHRRSQAELRMKNRTTYADHGLVFCKESADLLGPHAKLGQAMNTLTRQPFRALFAAAGVRPIKPHGLRHTSISLMLAAGVPVVVVARRVGHSNVAMTLNVYAHMTPDQNAAAADTLGALLHAR